MIAKLNFIERLICQILKKGKVPQHMAFIMDGNRRYAKNIGKSGLKGHQYGVEALKKCLLLCSQLQIKIVSLYCFSLQNFNRSEQEVEKLMSLAEQTFKQYSPVSHLLEQNGIKVRLIGDIEKLKSSVKQSLRQVQNRTKDNSRMTINLCFAYDSFYEINLAREKGGQNCSYEQLKENLLIKEDVDVIVRTSNQSRLSNFLLVQSRYSHLVVLKENWPELSWLSFLKIFMEYNYHYNAAEVVKQHQIIDNQPQQILKTNISSTKQE